MPPGEDRPPWQLTARFPLPSEPAICRPGIRPLSWSPVPDASRCLAAPWETVPGLELGTHGLLTDNLCAVARRGTARAGLGRAGRPVHQHGHRDHRTAAPQARRSAGYLHHARRRVPDQRASRVAGVSSRERVSSGPLPFAPASHPGIAVRDLLRLRSASASTACPIPAPCRSGPDGEYAEIAAALALVCQLAQ